MKHEDWVKTLKSDPVTFTEQQKNQQDERVKLAQKIRDKIGKDGKVDVIAGVFGEWKGCDGMVEEVIKPPEGGVFIKIYGCSYLYKGYPDDKRVHGLEMSKFIVSHMASSVAAKLPFTAAGLLFDFLFLRRNFIKRMEYLFNQINHRNRWYEIPEKEYSVPVKEIKRAMVEALKQEHNGWTMLIAMITKFMCLFIESDSAYRFRLQDALGAVDNSRARADGLKEFFRALDVLISRETAKGIREKWVFIKIVMRVALFLSPGLTRIIKAFLVNLDVEKVKMDEADWYFCLRWISYDFGGKDKEWRFAERDRIDEEKGHVFIL